MVSYLFLKLVIGVVQRSGDANTSQSSLGGFIKGGQRAVVNID
jgi:hypothetical protein